MSPEKNITLLSWIFSGVSLVLASLWILLTKRVFDLPKNYVLKEDFKEHQKEAGRDIDKIYEAFGEKVDRIYDKMDDGFRYLADKIDGVKK